MEKLQFLKPNTHLRLFTIQDDIIKSMILNMRIWQCISDSQINLQLFITDIKFTTQACSFKVEQGKIKTILIIEVIESNKLLQIKKKKRVDTEILQYYLTKQLNYKVIWI
ncbi:hypothetical protein pb186bvf_010882 [Paramecium bursaria]